MMIDIGTCHSFYINADKVLSIEQSSSANYRSLLRMDNGQLIYCESYWPREISKMIDEARSRSKVEGQE